MTSHSYKVRAVHHSLPLTPFSCFLVTVARKQDQFSPLENNFWCYDLWKREALGILCPLMSLNIQQWRGQSPPIKDYPSSQYWVILSQEAMLYGKLISDLNFSLSERPPCVPPSRTPKLLMSNTVAVLAFAVYTAISGFHTSPSHMGPRMVSHGEKDYFWFDWRWG